MIEYSMFTRIIYNDYREDDKNGQLVDAETYEDDSDKPPRDRCQP